MGKFSFMKHFPAIQRDSHGVLDNKLTYEPSRGKTNNVVSEQFPQKPACTSREDSYKLEISDLSRRGTVLSE